MPDVRVIEPDRRGDHDVWTSAAGRRFLADCLGIAPDFGDVFGNSTSSDVLS
jgi:hypothetical protein